MRARAYPELKTLCLNCGTMALHIRRGRCEACYAYFRRHQAERPEDLIVAQVRHQIERAHIKDAHKAASCCDTLVIVTADYVDMALCENPPGHLGWHRGWAGEWHWDRHSNLTFNRDPEFAEL